MEVLARSGFGKLGVLIRVNKQKRFEGFQLISLAKYSTVEP